MPEVTLSSKFEIVVPREVRQAMGLKPGDKVLILAEGNCIIVTKKAESRRRSRL
jgi:AbrB family looped-hinge helix DNA binding protein